MFKAKSCKGVLKMIQLYTDSAANLPSKLTLEKNIKVIVVSKGIDAVDFAILNNIEKGDIVITQDYGLASLVLSRNSYAINQSGMVYTNENIDELLYSRYISKKMRNSGARIKGPKKRDKSQDIIFKENLEKLILNII